MLWLTKEILFLKTKSKQKWYSKENFKYSITVYAECILVCKTLVHLSNVNFWEKETVVKTCYLKQCALE